MEPPTNWRDPSLLDHEPLLTYCSIYAECGSRRGAERKFAIERIVEAIQASPQFLAIVEAWLDLAFPSESALADVQSPSAHDPRMQAIFSEFYCRLKARDGPEEYLNREQRDFPSTTQNVGVSGRVGLSTGARGRGVNVGRGRGVNVGRGRGVNVGRGRGVSVGRGRGVNIGRGRGANVQDRGREVSVGSRRGSGRGHSKGHAHSNPERLRVPETSGGSPHESKERESDEFPVAKRTKSAGHARVTTHLPNTLQFLSQDDRSRVSRTSQGRSNPKRPRITEKPRERPRKSELRAPDVAPAAKRARKSLGHSSSQLASDLPNSMQLPGQDDHSDTGPSLSVRLKSNGRPELASNSQSHVHEATHAGRGKQNLAMSDLSRKRGRVDSGLQFNDPSHFLVPSPGLAVATTLPQSVRSVRPLPRRVSMKRILPRHAEQINRAAEPSVHALGQEDVDCFLKDVSSNTSLAHFQPISGPLENWTQTKDNDQDDVVDVDEIANEFDTPFANNAPLQVSSYEGAVEGSTSMIQPRKPPLPIRPPIWAQTRQEVCESFDYFRSYQGGVYSSKDIVKGYLLGGSPASRDICHDQGRLIVSHGGGKSESILDYRVGPARFQQAQDQEVTDKSVRALLKSYTDRRPLVLLVDEKYALFPFDLGASGYTYIVLGFYWISHAWAEYQPASNGSRRVVRWKFAFRWCGPEDPWWTGPKKEGILLDALRDRQSSNEQNSSAPNGITTITCNVCSKKSHVIYSQGWMCLHPSCSSFWSLGGREPGQLEYDATFLRPVTAEFRGLPDLRPGKLVKTIDKVTTSYAFRKGWYCEKCGRLSCRFKWEHWECSNCHSTYKVPGRLRVAKEFWHQRPTTEFFHSHIGKNSEITTGLLQPIEFGDGRGFTNYLTFVLPHQRGKIHLILGTPFANKQADDIFQQYQEQADKGELLLRRYPLRTSKVRGTLLTNYFSQNSGEPYQYVGGTGNTVPFDKAPSSVCGALALIKERARLVLRRDIPFNEILSAAYMERQKMSFHSDSEPGLGPVVASLSLGSAAFMHFRPHAVHTASKEAKNQSSIALTLILRHGDVLIMEGDGVQKYYEHAVTPMNFRIAATARCIGTT